MMKTVLKTILFIFALIIICLVGLIFYYNVSTSNIKLDESKLINLERTVTYYDSSGNVFAEEVNGKTISEIDKIPEHTLNAFVSIEDKRFYKHNGIDYKGLFRATLNNVKSFSFKEGASTISQQLIKNTHLSSEKTLNRKFAEIKLARQLENRYSKKEILEKYLNTIYFGDNCYGISCASMHYFAKTPAQLDINESAMLAGIIKAPSNYSPFVDYERCIKRKNVVLNEMFEQGYINEQQFIENKNKELLLTDNAYTSNEFTFLSLARKELNKIMKNAFYGVGNIKVYTSFDIEKQKILIENVKNNTDVDAEKSAILMNNNGDVEAYYSSCGDVNRQMGSIFKPIMVYAPAIQNNVVFSATQILDEKTEFDDYCPQNFNDKYYGYVSVRSSLAKSLNVCSVKILNYTGIENALKYVKKTNIPLSENDNSLSLALGATENGAPLSSITSAYTVFNNKGNYSAATFINRIQDENNNQIYVKNKKRTRIFDLDTIGIMNDMMSFCVEDGTAKKLSYTNFPLYAKTGTVGNRNGNSDAYTISYNADYVLGVWYGSENNKSLLSNNITGGGHPALTSSNIWQDIYKNKTAPNKIECVGTVEKYIDKQSYDQDRAIVLADEHCPERYKIKTIFKENYLPKDISTRFSSPNIENAKILAKSNEFIISLCLPEYIDVKIFRQNKGEKILVYDSKNKNKTEFVDKTVLPNETYIYSIIPYFTFDDFTAFGKEIKLKEVKLDVGNFDKWWKDDLD